MNQDIICFSHLRWNFVYQRPQHLLSRFGKQQRVIFFEEPEYSDSDDHYSSYKDKSSEVWIVTPVLFNERTSIPHAKRIEHVLNSVIRDFSIKRFISWYYTPMALQFSSHLQPEMIVYDCMDELSAFRNAPGNLIELERVLFSISDIIFTGGHHLFDHKKDLHHNIFPFPSSIDKEHFFEARQALPDPADQENIRTPRFGFYGVLDERFNFDLLSSVAEMRPSWNFILIGPICKIDPDALPALPNIFYLGQKEYQQLPQYLSGWDIAIMPFALNESTRYISPTKTPEYLAGGKPVISTSIMDVVRPYGEHGLVEIADTPREFVEKGEKLLSSSYNVDNWLKRVDVYLSGLSWDKTWSNMQQIIEKTWRRKNLINPIKNEAYV